MHQTDADIIRRYSSTDFMELLYQMHIPDITISKAVSMHTAGHMQERKFRNSLPNDLENAENTLPIIAMNKIKKLFAIEKEIEALSPDKKVKIRQLKSKPLIDDFFSWCKSNQNVAASAKLSRAFKYVLNHEEGLDNTYMMDIFQ